METFLLIVSAVLFIVTFGIHMLIMSEDLFDRPLYTQNSILSSIPWISGTILPVIPLTIIFHCHWIAIFVVNLALLYLLGPTLTKGFLVRFSTSLLGKDMLYSLIGGIVSLTIALLIR